MGKIDQKERCKQLLMALIDGEITAEEHQELERLLRQFPEFREELANFQELKEVTRAMKLKSPDPEVWQTYWQNVYNRIERGLAWLIFTVGAAILIAYGLMKVVMEIWNDPDLPAIVKYGLYGVILGLVLLLISVLREKLYLRKHERYKEVKI